jgi:lambda family phage tail tape measure protein
MPVDDVDSDLTRVAERDLDRLDAVNQRMRDLTFTANAFARSMSGAFAQSVTGARGFDDMLKSLYLRLSDLTLRAAFKPLERGIASSFQNLFGGLFGGTPTSAIATSGAKIQNGACEGYAMGGVIGAPTYFPLPSGGLGLAGEAGPEAIMPLARGADGRLGVASAGGGAFAPVTVNITTQDAGSFRRSESYITGQIARAVARGQRGL